jgi:hypothetical protein
LSRKLADIYRRVLDVRENLRRAVTSRRTYRVVLDFGARAQDFLLSASPLSLPISPPTAALGTLALQKLHRICQAEVRTLKARYTLATVKLALYKYRERDPRRRTRSLWIRLCTGSCGAPDRGRRGWLETFCDLIQNTAFEGVI